VVLVLLIICMVVAPRMDQGIQIDVPGIFNPDPEVKTAVDPLKLSVAKKGEYYINDQPYDLDTAVEMLSAEHASDPYRRLLLRADAQLTYGDVREILARAQKVGFPGMALMVGERHRNQPEPGTGNEGGTRTSDGPRVLDGGEG
jgi:biopolymer transport protein ExbD